MKDVVNRLARELADVIAEAHLDEESIFSGVRRFALDHESRISRQRRMLGG